MMEYKWSGPGSLSHNGRMYSTGDLVNVTKNDRQHNVEIKKLIDLGKLYREDFRKKKK